MGRQAWLGGAGGQRQVLLFLKPFNNGTFDINHLLACLGVAIFVQDALTDKRVLLGGHSVEGTIFILLLRE
jgi:hypothetical protein